MGELFPVKGKWLGGQIQEDLDTEKTGKILTPIHSERTFCERVFLVPSYQTVHNDITRCIWSGLFRNMCSLYISQQGCGYLSTGHLRGLGQLLVMVGNTRNTEA